MVRVKICGITNVEDALYAAETGADALGFVFYEGSPRYVYPRKAREIIQALPPFITTVGLFVNAPASEVRDAVFESGVKLLQFHGSEEPDYCRSFGLEYIKAFRVKGRDSLSDIGDYAAAAYLLDSYSDKEFGGTGKTFDWDAAIYAKRFGRVILAGGLRPGNVADAVARVNPYAVDVSSGVEAAKGIKDKGAVKQFITNAKGLGPTRF